MASSLKTLKVMTALFIAMAFIFVGNSLVISSAGIGLKEIGANDFETGLVISCFFIGAISCTIVSHKVISAYGHIRAYSIFTAFFAIAALFHEFSSNIIFWAFLRFMLGFCYYSLVMIIESWINEKTPNAIRSRVLAVYEMVYYGSSVIGVLLLKLNLGIDKIFLIATLMLILGLIPFSIINIKQPKIPPKERISFPNIFKLIPLALATSFIAGIVINGMLTMSNVYILAQGFGAAEVSTFVSLAMAGGFVSHILNGFLSDKFGRKNAITFSCTVALCVTLYIAIKNPDINVQNILAPFLGFGVFPLYVLALARANDVLHDKSKRVEISRALLSSYLCGSFSAALILGTAINLFGAIGYIYVYCIVLVFLLLFSIFSKYIPREQRMSLPFGTAKAMNFEVKEDS